MLWLPETRLGSTYLSELFDLCSLYPDDWASQTLVNQQSKLTVEVHAIVLLVLGGKYLSAHCIKVNLAGSGHQTRGGIQLKAKPSWAPPLWPLLTTSGAPLRRGTGRLNGGLLHGIQACTQCVPPRGIKRREKHFPYLLQRGDDLKQDFANCLDVCTDTQDATRCVHQQTSRRRSSGAGRGGEEEEDQTGDVTKGEKEGTLEQGIHNIPSAEC